MTDSNGNDNCANQLGNMIIPLLQNRDTCSPPKAEVDEASLQKAMDRNKEALKVKLMVRRPLNQLVQQGIMKSLKTSPHFHEQKQKLERAKMGDYLKYKIQRRPDRQELIQQHILEDTTIDPSLQDKQRQLKKCKLADDLNDRISHRPGPLELIKGNILQTDEEFAQAVKEGQIPFKRTCEGQSLKHPPPLFVFEEDSGSDVALSPPQDTDQSLSSIPSLEPLPTSNHGSPSQTEFRPHSTLLPSLSLRSSHSASQTTVPQAESSQIKETTTRNRKKSKPKSQSKPRTIKFHEYKGPPNAQKNQTTTSSSAETSYELLLHQQQLFLQWQLQLQQKYTQMILPTVQSSSGDQGQTSVNVPISHCEQSQESTSSPQKTLSKLEDMKVSDLKAELKKRSLPVSGSKPQLIERLKSYSDMTVNSANSVSTSLSETIATVTCTTPTLPVNVGSILLDTIPDLAQHTKTETFSVPSIVAMDSTGVSTSAASVGEDAALVVYNAPSCGTTVVTPRSPSVTPMDVDASSNHAPDTMDCSDSSVAINQNIVKLQQKQIEELQRELHRSQMQLQHQWLQHQQPQQAVLTTQPVSIAPAQIQPQLQSQAQMPIVTISSAAPHQSTSVDTKALHRLQQHLQQKLQQQQLAQQQKLNQHQAIASISKFLPTSSASAAVKANLAAFIHNHHPNNNNSSNSSSNNNSNNPNIVNPPSLSVVSQQSLVTFPATVVTSPGTQQLMVCQQTTEPCPGNSAAGKPRANSLPNGFAHQRLLWTSSLPNFSSIVTSKSQPTRTNTESQLIITQPPPDYNEATKQLSKTKLQGQQFPSNLLNQLSNKRTGKISVKSQAVDDVLEILIKNGELPPSAAQEPPTPTTPETQKSGSTSLPPVFPSSSEMSPECSQSSGSNKTSHTTTSTSLPTNGPAASLSSVSEGISMTSPPSSVLGETDTSAAPSLDFDFHLDLDDIEAMDLGVLTHDTTDSCRAETSGSAQPTANHTLNHSFGHQQNELADLSNTAMDMDIELSDWLDVMVPITSATSTSSANLSHTQPIYSRSSDHDPLLSNLANTHDTFDLFSLEDIEFKTPTDISVLTWDKVDYAT